MSAQHHGNITGLSAPTSRPVSIIVELFSLLGRLLLQYSRCIRLLHRHGHDEQRNTADDQDEPVGPSPAEVLVDESSDYRLRARVRQSATTNQLSRQLEGSKEPGISYPRHWAVQRRNTPERHAHRDELMIRDVDNSAGAVGHHGCPECSTGWWDIV